MNKVTVQNVRAARLLARLNPSLRQALRGVRKLHFKRSTTDAELVAWTLAVALSHWNKGMARTVGTDRHYCSAEDIDLVDYYKRNLEALWER